MQNRPLKDERYKRLMVKATFRWADWMKIRSKFPAFKGESVAEYMHRLSFYLPPKETTK